MRVTIEGMSAEALLLWPASELRQLLEVGRPIVFSAGSATVLAQLHLAGERLTIELAHIDGGGEGVLPTLWRFGERYARIEGVSEIEWLIHATRCAAPNPRLPPLLLKLGFQIEELPVMGKVYRRVDAVPAG